MTRVESVEQTGGQRLHELVVHVDSYVSFVEAVCPKRVQSRVVNFVTLPVTVAGVK